MTALIPAKRLRWQHISVWEESSVADSVGSAAGWEKFFDQLAPCECEPFPRSCRHVSWWPKWWCTWWRMPWWLRQLSPKISLLTSFPISDHLFVCFYRTFPPASPISVTCYVKLMALSRRVVACSSYILVCHDDRLLTDNSDERAHTPFLVLLWKTFKCPVLVVTPTDYWTPNCLLSCHVISSPTGLPR